MTRLTRSYWWCVVFHSRHHREVGSGAFHCLKCYPIPEFPQ